MRVARFFFSSCAVAAVVIACGARTGLDVPGPNTSIDATIDVEDAPSQEGHALDVVVDCAAPAYCDPNDPTQIYKCGVPIYQCGSLEQCEEVPEEGAECINPCLDTLGQDTSNGCDFYAVEMDTTDEAVGVCYAVFVVNQWKSGEAAKLEVSLAGNVLPIDQFARIPVGKGTGITYGPFDPKQGLPTNEVAILFLSRDPNGPNDPNPTDPRTLASCPAGVTPAVSGDAAIHGTGVGNAFHIKSNVPVVAYQMLPYGAGRARVTGATLLLPTNVWGNNYVAANAYAAPVNFSEARAGPTMAILGRTDGTNVTIKPTTDILAGGTLQGTPAGTPVTYQVNAGQYLQFTQPLELTGSAIQSDQPIAVIGGATVVDIPTSIIRADSAEQMLPPVQALSNDYVAVRYRNRQNRGEEQVPWRVVGVVDGTNLTYDPAPPPGSPSSINAGELFEFDASGPFIIRSQDAAHPFYLAQYMTGGQITTTGNTDSDGEGDPEFINVIAPEQYLPRYTFFTDPTYPETNLVIVRVRDSATGLMPDVNLDCAGLLSGWTPIDLADSFEFTRADLQTGNFSAVNNCDNGVHVLTTSFPGIGDGGGGGAEGGGPGPVAKVGVTIWGWGNTVTWPTDNGASDEANPLFTRWVSYGYPAGANIKPLNNVVFPAQ